MERAEDIRQSWAGLIARTHMKYGRVAKEKPKNMGGSPYYPVVNTKPKLIFKGFKKTFQDARKGIYEWPFKQGEVEVVDYLLINDIVQDAPRDFEQAGAMVDEYAKAVKDEIDSARENYDKLFDLVQKNLDKKKTHKDKLDDLLIKLEKAKQDLKDFKEKHPDYKEEISLEKEEVRLNHEITLAETEYNALRGDMHISRRLSTHMRKLIGIYTSSMQINSAVYVQLANANEVMGNTLDAINSILGSSLKAAGGVQALTEAAGSYERFGTWVEDSLVQLAKQTAKNIGQIHEFSRPLVSTKKAAEFKKLAHQTQENVRKALDADQDVLTGSPAGPVIDGEAEVIEGSNAGGNDNLEGKIAQ